MAHVDCPGLRAQGRMTIAGLLLGNRCPGRPCAAQAPPQTRTRCDTAPTNTLDASRCDTPKVIRTLSCCERNRDSKLGSDRHHRGHLGGGRAGDRRNLRPVARQPVTTSPCPRRRRTGHDSRGHQRPPRGRRLRTPHMPTPGQRMTWPASTPRKPSPDWAAEAARSGWEDFRPRRQVLRARPDRKDIPVQDFRSNRSSFSAGSVQFGWSVPESLIALRVNAPHALAARTTARAPATAHRLSR